MRYEERSINKVGSEQGRSQKVKPKKAKYQEESLQSYQTDKKKTNQNKKGNGRTKRKVKPLQKKS